MTKIKKEVRETLLLLRNVPSLIMVLFVLSCVGMNLLANKELFNMQYLALDCGFLLSWAAFLCGDMLTKHFGAKASIRLSIVAMMCNLLVCGVFWFATTVSTGNWGAFYDTGNPIVNAALDTTIAPISSLSIHPLFKIYSNPSTHKSDVAIDSLAIACCLNPITF